MYILYSSKLQHSIKVLWFKWIVKDKNKVHFILCSSQSPDHNPTEHQLEISERQVEPRLHCTDVWFHTSNSHIVKYLQLNDLDF